MAMLASPSYASSFADELANPGIRIPITAVRKTFQAGALLGARVVWLQSFGERWLSKERNLWSRIEGSARVIKPIPEDEEGYPREFAYDETSEALSVGSGIIGSVSPKVYGYSQSGFKVVTNWLRYRMAERGGRARRASSRSELDEIRPRRWSFTEELLQLLWVVEGCVSLWPELAALLQDIVRSDLLYASILPQPTREEQNEPESTDSIQRQLL